MSTHDDDEFVIRANQFIKGGMTDDPVAIELVTGLLNRVGEKKVEIRGLEGQIKTLQEQVAHLQNRVDHLEMPYVPHRPVNDDTDLNWVPADDDPSQK